MPCTTQAQNTALVLAWVISVFFGFLFWSMIKTDGKKGREQMKNVALFIAITNIFIPGLAILNFVLWANEAAVRNE
uniref:Uncharacterized protein n=1 Tax=viral metagenome TaxID=1070528 RepID=A0A6C0KGD8_9ZZZZ